MDWLKLLESYGVPLVVAGLFWAFIVRNNTFLQNTLMSELDQDFKRLEMILVKLIDQQKKIQLEQKGLQRSYRTLVEIISALSGNGLKDKFMRIQERDEDENNY